MAIYRPSKPRWRATVIAAAACLVVGGLAGWVIGSRTEPDTTEAVRSIRSSLAGVSGALEVVEIEYSEAVLDGEVVAEPEYEGARDAAEKAMALFAEVQEPLELLEPEATSEIESSLDELIEAIESTADESEVVEMAGTASGLVSGFGWP